jgi:hypothetical protein
MSALDELGVAAHRKLRAQIELAAANTALTRALREVHRQGIPKCRIGPLVRDNLALHGFAPEDIRRIGLSNANIRLMLERR